MKFRVTVRTSTGQEEKREIEADSRFGVYSQMEKEGSTVLALDEGGGFVMPKWTQMTIGKGIKTEERITFTKNLSAMLSAGLTLPRALSVIERQSKNKVLKRIVNDLESRIKAGSSFHEGLEVHAKVFPKLFIAMSKAGEESGTLADTLKIIAKQMDRSATLNKKIKGAMIYPSIILFAIVVIGILMLIFVIPTLTATFRSLGAKLPISTQIIIALSDFASHHAFVVLLLLGAAIVGGWFYMRTTLGKKTLLFVALHFPVIGDLTRETFSARASRTLASLLSSGVDMLQALSITQEVVGENPFGKVVEEAATRVRKGEALSVSFVGHSKLYPVFVGDMIAVGEETGKVSDMLNQVAEYYENDVEDRTKDLSTIIEPMLMLFIGVFVGIFAVSMIAPIYSLSSSLGG